MWKEHHTVSELEFLAEQTLIEIKPFFKKEELHLLGVKNFEETEISIIYF